MGERMKDIGHFFETEIKHAEQHIADDNCYAFNGVDFFPDREKVIELNKNHIKFCRMILERLG